MNQEKTTTASRWVDMSGTESEGDSSNQEKQTRNTKNKKYQSNEDHRHEKRQYGRGDKYHRQPQYKKKYSESQAVEIPIEDLDKIQGEYLWLLVAFNSRNRQIYQQLKEKLENLKEEDSNIKVFRSIKNKDGTSTFTIDLYIPRAMAEKFLKSGFSESETRMKFTIHSRNFNRREDRGERGDRRGGRGRGNKRGYERNYNEESDRDNRDNGHRRNYRDNDKRRDNDRGDRKKPTYIDKNTGQKSDNKKNFEQRQIEENNRQYSKKQASIIGDQIGAFRNKKKSEVDEQVETEQVEQKFTEKKMNKEKEPYKKEDKREKDEKNQESNKQWKRKSSNHEIPVQNSKKQSDEKQQPQEKPQQKKKEKNRPYNNNKNPNKDYNRPPKPYHNDNDQKHNPNKKKYVARQNNNTNIQESKKQKLKDQNAFGDLIQTDSDEE